MASRTNQLDRSAGEMRNGSTWRNSDNPEVIRTQIEQTRTEMGQTIQQLQERLSPERIKEQIQESVKDATIGKVEQMAYQAEYEVKSWPRRLSRTVKENPMPAALIGIGIGWLLVSDRDDDYGSSNRGRRMHSYGEDVYYGDRDNKGWVGDQAEDARQRVSSAANRMQNRAEDAVENVRNRAEDVVDNVQERASELGEQVQETAGEARDYAQQTAAQLEVCARESVRRTKQTFWETMNENPMLVGAAALAVGAAIGAALPSTPTENRLMGEQRDHLMEEAKETVQETTRKVQDVVREAKDAAVETAKEEAEEKNLRPTSSFMTKEGTTTSTPQAVKANHQ